MNIYNTDNIEITNDNSIHSKVQNEPCLNSFSSDINGITILIALYNGVQYLEQSVTSVINQTYGQMATYYRY